MKTIPFCQTSAVPCTSPVHAVASRDAFLKGFAITAGLARWAAGPAWDAHAQSLPAVRRLQAEGGEFTGGLHFGEQWHYAHLSHATNP